MSINNDVHGVMQYLQNLDRTLPLDMYITIPRGNLKRPNKAWREIHKETSDAVEYILRKEGNPEHLSFDTIMAAEPEYWAHAVYPFYFILLKCDWIKSEILSAILKFIDPLERHIYITHYESNHFYSTKDGRFIIRPINVITQLICSPFQCLLLEVLNQANVNASFPDPIRLNVDLDALKRAMKYPRKGHLHNDITNWNLDAEEEKHLPAIVQGKGTSIFMLLLGNLRANDLPQWQSPYYRIDPSLTNFRHKILNPMIQLGLDVKRQADHIFIWDPSKISLITSILAEFIRHGLMNFHCRSKASLPLRLICFSISPGRRDTSYRRWRKLRHLLELIHRLGGQWHEEYCQREAEERAMKKFRTRGLKDELFQPLTYYLERLRYPTDPEDWGKLEWTLDFVRGLRRQPLRLSDLSRISIRKATGGKHFQASILQLPLPIIMKDFVRADLFPHFLDIYGI